AARRPSAGPMTLTRTFAWRRSGCVSTPVIVANPIRGSSTSFARIAPISWRKSSSIRSVRAVIGQLRSSAASTSAREDPADGLRREALDDVAFLEVVVPREPDAALVVALDLPDVVAEPAERLDPVGDHDLAVA